MLTREAFDIVMLISFIAFQSSIIFLFHILSTFLLFSFCKNNIFVATFIDTSNSDCFLVLLVKIN